MLTTLSLLATVALAEGPAPAAEPAKSPVIAKIEARYAKVDAMRMGFTQTVDSPLYGKVKQAGTMAFARPGKLRWTFTDEGKHYISDGSVMWVYVEENKQAFKYSGWDTTQSAESLIGSLDKLDSLFKVTVDASNDDGHALTLRPKEDNVPYDHLELSLDGELVVSSLTLYDGAGTTTKLEFSGVELGPELPADTFTFTPPAGVEVIEAAFPQQ